MYEKYQNLEWVPTEPRPSPGRCFGNHCIISMSIAIFAAHLSSSFIFARLAVKQKPFWLKLRSKSSELYTFSFTSLTGDDLKLQIYKQCTTRTRWKLSNNLYYIIIMSYKNVTADLFLSVLSLLSISFAAQFCWGFALQTLHLSDTLTKLNCNSSR